MELTLARQAGTQVLVTCDSDPRTHLISSPFQASRGLLNQSMIRLLMAKRCTRPYSHQQSAARRELEAMPERILLVSTDDDIDSVPWEYAYGLYGADDIETFLVLACHVVRGLPLDKRIEPPTMDEWFTHCCHSFQPA